MTRAQFCSGKKSYSSATEARFYAHKVNQRNPRGIRPNAYQCAECGLWHIGRHLKDVKRLFRRSQ